MTTKKYICRECLQECGVHEKPTRYVHTELDSGNRVDTSRDLVSDCHGAYVDEKENDDEL